MKHSKVKMKIHHAEWWCDFFFTIISVLWKVLEGNEFKSLVGNELSAIKIGTGYLEGEFQTFSFPSESRTQGDNFSVRGQSLLSSLPPKCWGTCELLHSLQVNCGLNVVKPLYNNEKLVFLCPQVIIILLFNTWLVFGDKAEGRNKAR